MSRTSRLLLTLSLAALSSAAPAARAQGLILPRPIPPVPNPQPLTVRSQQVSMELTNGALKVEVDQVFYNPNRAQMEGTYLFPLPAGAAVASFRMTIDKEPVDGKILTVEEARKVYESYVRRNVDPAILEYVGRNAFQARVFPIPPGGQKRIHLGYSQPAAFNNGVYQVVYPLRSERVTGQTAGNLTIGCTLRSAQPIRAIYSPTHEIQVKRESDHLARVTFEGTEVRADRDFVLYYSTSEKSFGLNALAHRKAGEDGYVMLMLAPKREVKTADVQPKDVVFVCDTSGSMQGAKIEQARKALQATLAALNAQDRFNIIRFSTDVTRFREGVVPASPENRAAARAFIDEFKAVGGTAIDDALQAGLASVPKPETGSVENARRASFLIFMTDGLPTIGNSDITQILANAAKAAPRDVRLFSFGVGADVNTLLLDRLAADNRGAADYIAQNEDLEAKIGSFYAKIADPVLADVKVTLEGGKLLDVYPNRLPDLFAGTQLLILARYQGQGKASITLTGDLNGAPQRFSYPLTLPEREPEQSFIPKLWANRRIGFLLEEIRLRGENAELKGEVIRLSKEYGIVTPYTAYLVEEPGLAPPSPATRGVRFFGLQERDGLPGGVQLDAAGAGGFGGRAAGGTRLGRSGDAPQRAKGDVIKAGKPAAPAAGVAAAPEDRATQLLYARQREAQLKARQQADGYNRTTGQNAVEASRRLNELKDKRVAETEVELKRTIEGRAFRYHNGGWEDQTIQGKLRIVPVKYGSEAYFALIAHRAEWARFLSAGRSVTFRSGAGSVVVVSEKGREKLSAAEIRALEK